MAIVTSLQGEHEESYWAVQKEMKIQKFENVAVTSWKIKSCCITKFKESELQSHFFTRKAPCRCAKPNTVSTVSAKAPGLKARTRDPELVGCFHMTLRKQTACKVDDDSEQLTSHCNAVL